MCAKLFAKLDVVKFYRYSSILAHFIQTPYRYKHCKSATEKDQQCALCRVAAELGICHIHRIPITSKIPP